MHLGNAQAARTGQVLPSLSTDGASWAPRKSTSRGEGCSVNECSRLFAPRTLSIDRDYF